MIKLTVSKARWSILVAAMAAVSLSAADGHETPAVRKYLTHPGFRWTCEGKSTFRFCYPPGLESVVVGVKRDARQSLAKTMHLAGISNYTTKPLIYIFLLESGTRLRELIHVNAYGASEPKDHSVFFLAGHTEALTHEPPNPGLLRASRRILPSQPSICSAGHYLTTAGTFLLPTWLTRVGTLLCIRQARPIPNWAAL
jgi:hypothetical protein